MECEIKAVLEKIKGTQEYEILLQMQKAYERIEEEQKLWYEKAEYSCPAGCGTCCHNFEPDLLECEALFMAAWLLENQNETALKIAGGEFPFNANLAEKGKRTCPLFNPDSEYHCSIYNGRAFICRLFGGSGTRSKDGSLVWKPCRFFPEERLCAHKPPLAHRQYTQNEIEDAFGLLPPVMSDLMEQAVNIIPGRAETELLHEILPKAINRLLWICQMTENV